MRAIWSGVVIADSEDTVVVESNHYFPRDSLVTEYFSESQHTSYCPWKGTANYYSITVGGETNEKAAWYYAEPKPEANSIRDRVAFWNGVEVTDT